MLLFLSVNFGQTPFYQYTLFSENFQFFFNIRQIKWTIIHLQSEKLQIYNFTKLA